MVPWLRRLITRSLAIIPAVLTIVIAGERATLSLIILSQVVLSMQLPFAVIPLIRFTNDRTRMGEFANKAWVKVLAWVTAAVILVLNLWLAYDTAGAWVMASPWRVALVAPLLIALIGLLGYITFTKARAPSGETPALSSVVAANLPAPQYHRILVPLDHTVRDRAAIAHAAAMARLHGATLHLLHVEEGVLSQLYGELSSTAEVHEGEEYFSGIVRTLEAEGIHAELTIAHGRSPKDEIVRLAKQIHPDLVVMGAHGHRGVKDLIFGNTINAVRHELSAPVLVVGDQ